MASKRISTRLAGRKQGLLVAALVATLAAWMAPGLGTAVEFSGNAIRVRNAFTDARVPLASGPGEARYFNSFSGELYPDLMAASISAQREFRRAIPSVYSYNQTAHYQRRTVLGADALASESAEVVPLQANSLAAPGSRWVMWDVPFMMQETRKAHDKSLGYEQRMSGFATGITRLVGETGAVGLAVGYDGRKLRGRDGYHMKNKADTMHLALYGGWAVGCLMFDTYAGFSRSWNRTERNVYSAAGTGEFEMNKANFNDTVLSAGMKMSYVIIAPGDVRIVPSVGADFSHVRSGEFTEKNWNDRNNASRLHVNRSTYANVQVPVTVSINRTFASSFLRSGGHQSLWTPEFRAGYIPQFGGKNAEASMRLVNRPNGRDIKYRAKSANLAESYATVGAGLKVQLRDRLILGIDYDCTIGDRYTNHSVTAMYGASF